MDQSLEFRSHFVHFPHHLSEETSKKFIINRIFELPKRCSKSLCIHILKNHISSRLIWFWSFPLFREHFGVAMKIKKRKRFLFLKFSLLSEQGLLWSEYRVFSRFVFVLQKCKFLIYRVDFGLVTILKNLKKCIEQILKTYVEILSQDLRVVHSHLLALFFQLLQFPWNRIVSDMTTLGNCDLGLGDDSEWKNTRRANKKRKFTEVVCDLLFLLFFTI